MSEEAEEKIMANWIAERRGSAPGLAGDFEGRVMKRVLEMAATPTVAEKFAAMAGKLVPARRRRFVYLGSSAFAGALRLTVILYLVLGVS